MTNAEIINILKTSSDIMHDALSQSIVPEHFKTSGMFCDCHNHTANAVDAMCWDIAQKLGFSGDYDEFINSMIDTFEGTSNPPKGWDFAD